jgi:hypothetical protein
MGFALKGFVMGAAAAVGEKLDADEKAAREAAKLSATNLFKTYEANKIKTEEQVTKYTNNIALLKTNFKGLTEDQLYAGATNNAFMEGVTAAVKERNIDLSKIDTNQLIKIADTAPTKETAEQRVRKLFDESNVQPMQAAPQGLGYFRDRQANIQQQEFQRTAKALGIEPAALMASGKAKMPVAGVPDAEFNVAILNKVKTLQEQKDLIASEIVEAKRSNDEVRLAKATEDADRIRIAEDLTAKSSKTEDQIQTDLRNRIMSTNSLKEKTILTAELRQRQVLSKLPGEGQEKVSQSNLITVASKAITAAVSDRLPPGSFVITTDAQGNQSLAPKDIVSAKTFNEAVTAGRTSVIKEMTGSDGKPRDQLHRNALISIGVGFDDQGRAVLPASGGTPPPAAAKPAAPTTPAKPATTAQPTTAMALPYTKDGAADKGKLIKGQAYDDGNGNVKTWTGIGWK